MKRILFAPTMLAFLTLLTSPASAAFNGPNAMIVTEVAEVSSAPNDCLCILEGNIIEKVKGEKEYYVMKDPTGMVFVEIDDVVFSDKTVTPKDKIRAHGRIDKNENVMGKDSGVVEIYFFEVI
ncbi:MAG: NirD/YgiW/YdeI family stress tolerance protein [Pseudomonadota bacterium]